MSKHGDKSKARGPRAQYPRKEPLIHSHITDLLPANHPLAYKQVGCKACGALVHAFNNECMRTWVEAGHGNFCLQCFALTGTVLRLDMGLK